MPSLYQLTHTTSWPTLAITTNPKVLNNLVLDNIRPIIFRILVRFLPRAALLSCYMALLPKENPKLKPILASLPKSTT
jgi:hypothetical protein